VAGEKYTVIQNPNSSNVIKILHFNVTSALRAFFMCVGKFGNKSNFVSCPPVCSHKSAVPLASFP